MAVVDLSRLFAMLIAAALLFAPFAMFGGHAMAAMPADHGEMKGHCDGQPATDEESPAMPCCTAMCAAIAVAPAAAASLLPFARSAGRLSLDRMLPSFLAKLPTPPPRLA